MAFDYSRSFSYSFNPGFSIEQSFTSAQLSPELQKKFLSNVNLSYSSSITPGALANAPGSLEAFTIQATPSWKFITAPEEVSWDLANQANRIDIFGTNNPPVVAGSRGMRDLTLNNSLVEGFVRNVTIESKVAALEALLNYGLNSSDGFVSVPVYQVWANSKSYGGPEAYFIIKDVKVKETMRDLKGDATRAYVDISLMQVPKYQVNSGRDQASSVTAGAKSGLLSEAQARAAQQAKPSASDAEAKSKGNQGVGATKPAQGAGAPSAPPTKTAQRPTTARQTLRSARVIMQQNPTSLPDQ